MKSEGIVVRIPDGKWFGFIQIGNKDYFFHRQDCNVDWDEIIVGAKVLCEITESPKGLRVTNVSLA